MTKRIVLMALICAGLLSYGHALAAPPTGDLAGEYAGSGETFWATSGLPFGQEGLNGAPDGACAAITLTQNTNSTTVTAGSIACAGGTPQRTTENAYARSYDLSTGVTANSAVRIKCVDFGVETNTENPYTVTINIYADTNGGDPVGPAPIPGADLTLIGSQTVNVPTPTTLQILTATFPGTGLLVPANTRMVVEIFAPDRQVPAPGSTQGAFFVGINSGGQTAPCFLRASACGLATYSRYSSIGFGNLHLFQRVDLNLEGAAPTGACCVDQGGGTFQCTDGQTVEQCNTAGGRWTFNTTCAQLNPQCGRGACCLQDGSCVDNQTEANCRANPNFRRFILGAACATASCPPPICPITIPGGAIPENEPCGQTANNGCNVTPNVFAPISCGQTVTGTIWLNAAGTRDTDWYELNLAQDGRIRWRGTAQFPLQLLIIDGNQGCPAGGPTILHTGLGSPCQEVVVDSANLTAGRYFLHVTSQRGQGVIECDDTGDFGSKYFAKVECLDATGACCLFTCPGTCLEISEAQCTALGRVFLGVGTICEGPCIQPPPPECCPGDSDSDGVRTSLDIQGYVAAFVSNPVCGSNEYCLANMDGNDVLNQTDLNLFVAAVLASERCPSAGPVNNDCANAIAIGDVTDLPYSTIGATTDGPTEPNPPCTANPEADVWYCYTASCTGTVTVATCNSDFDTVLAAYNSDANCTCPTGASAVACNDDLCLDGDSIIQFPVTAGNKYLIRVGGFLGTTPPASTGTGVLNVSCSN